MSDSLDFQEQNTFSSQSKLSKQIQWLAGHHCQCILKALCLSYNITCTLLSTSLGKSFLPAIELESNFANFCHDIMQNQL